MISYEKLLKRYEEFNKIYEALKFIRPGRLYKLTPPPGSMGPGPLSGYLDGWHIGILNRCKQNGLTFRMVASQEKQISTTDGFIIILYKLSTYKIEQLRMTDLPAYV